MIQRGQGPGFTVEAGQSLRIRGDRLGEDLDGDLSSEIRVGRLIDLAHATGSER